MDLSAVEEYLKNHGQPNFRIKQIRDGFFNKYFNGFNELTNLPLELRNDLEKKFSWFLLTQESIQESNDKETKKYLFRLKDDNFVESVLITYKGWNTACLSVMSGCPLNCSFCATGQIGFKRNLTLYEIVDQIVFLDHDLQKDKKRISRIVFMGMGEPFLNWENVYSAIKIINSKDGLNIGQRHITVSTAGIIKGITEFTGLNMEVNLAISLHSPFQEKREKIMPVAKENPLDKLMEAALDYVNKTKRKLFFEYALIKDFNDRKEDIDELKRTLNHPLFHLNVIRLNTTDCGLLPPEKKIIDKFLIQLDNLKIPYTLRRSVGEEINAACGQLAGNQFKN